MPEQTVTSAHDPECPACGGAGELRYGYTPYRPCTLDTSRHQYVPAADTFGWGYRFYGVPIESDEESERFIAFGHWPDRLMLAASTAYARRVSGYRYQSASPSSIRIRRRWARFYANEVASELNIAYGEDASHAGAVPVTTAGLGRITQIAIDTRKTGT
jgi:hypothetical protein